jgi:hypothetical protein
VSRKLRAAVIATVALVGTLVATPRAEAASLAFRPTADGFTKQNEPRTDLSSRSWLTANGQPGRQKRIYLTFPVRGVPAGATGLTATLKLRARTTAARPVQVHASRNVSWTEGSLVHVRRPGYRAAVLDSVPGTTAGRWATFDVSAAVRGNGPVTFVLTVPSAGDTLFDSRDARTGMPRLGVRWGGGTGGSRRPPHPGTACGAPR